MKKNILVLTTAYAGEEFYYQTPVVHYFVKEWVKMGYNVRVVHNLTIFPKIYYKIAKPISNWISHKAGFKINLKRLSENVDYELDHVAISRLPILKYMPHGRFLKKEIKKQTFKITSVNTKYGFVPDVIIGHGVNPQIELINDLKEIYDATTCLIVHEGGSKFLRLFNKECVALLKGIDIIGYRSIPIKEKFQENFGSFQKSFICSSGIPPVFLDNSKRKKYENRLHNFVFVGSLIERKKPKSLIPAILKNYPENDFSITYIGLGPLEAKIKSLITHHKIESQVKLLGQLPRTEISNVLRQMDCFIMIASNETFGLVYLEAMAAGCITICAKKDGIDGIIVHGINGFLCEAGNIDELAKLIKHINELPIKEKQQIADNAIQTASKYSDYNAAAAYIKSLESFL